MQKRHFIALADYFRTEHPYNSTEQHQQEAFADFLKTQNHHFLRERWLGYVRGECGPNGGNIKKCTNA